MGGGFRGSNAFNISTPPLSSSLWPTIQTELLLWSELEASCSCSLSCGLVLVAIGADHLKMAYDVLTTFEDRDDVITLGPSSHMPFPTASLTQPKVSFLDLLSQLHPLPD